ncbi:MAG: hypothetical protein U9R29_10860 [Thermodesulfobacteriota bacterium]|nr:hypothetical protein [Thermodesulfobacteriota bacterium]
MGNRLKQPFATYGILLAVILYGAILAVLLIWVKQLTPTEPATITRIDLNNKDDELILSGHHLPPALSAVITPNIQRQETTVNKTFTWGKVFDLAVQNNHLWIANGVNGLLSYNLAQPTNPLLEGVLHFDGRAWKVALNNDNAFVAGGTSGMFGVDISDPTQPKLAFTKYCNKIILDVAATNDYAIAVAAKSGITILDTAQMAHPKEIAAIALEGTLLNISLHHNIAYILGIKKRRGILHVIDLHNPCQPEKLATLQLPSPCWDSIVIGSKLVVAMGRKGMYTIDINNPAMPLFSPQQIDQIEAYGLSISGNDLLVTSKSPHIYHYRNNNGHLNHLKTFYTLHQCQSSAIYKNYLVANIGIQGFSIIDSNKTGETIAAVMEETSTNHRHGQILSRHGTTCISSRSSLRLLQATANGNLKQYTSVHFNSKINTLTMDQRFAYVALTNQELHIVTLNPTAQQRVISISKWPHTIHHLVAQDDHLYIGLRDTGLFVLDPDNINQTQVSEKPLIATAHTAIAIKKSLLYMTTKPNGFNVYRINKDSKPILIGKLSYPLATQGTSLATDLAIHDGYAFISNGNYGILSIDISNPKQPRVGDSLDLSDYCSKIKILDNHAYVTLNYKKIVIIDISAPEKMKIVCELPTTSAISTNNKKLLKLSKKGVSISNPVKPLPIIQQNNTSMRLNLPSVTHEGYYDLQLAVEQQLTTHSDLLHYSPQQGWSMTRTFENQQNDD